MTMRILFITRVYPYPCHAGDLQYTAGIIESLSAMDETQVNVFCGNGVPDIIPTSTINWLGKNETTGHAADFRSLVSIYPRAAERALSSSALKALGIVLEENEFDIVLLNEAVTAKAKPILDKYNLPSIYISHNVDADIRPQIAAASKKRFIRWIQMLDAIKYRKMELSFLKQVQAFTAISREDQDRYKELGYSLPSEILKPGYTHSVLEETLPHYMRKNIAVLVGSFEWNAKLANLEMILEAYKSYMAKPSSQPFHLRIAGKADPKVVKRLTNQYPQVEFMCPFEHLSDAVKEARVALVLEEMGGGFKLKILDYIFSNLAIVAFPHAMQGTELAAGLEYQDAPTMEKAIEIVGQLIEDVERLEKMTHAARQKAETEYDWNERATILLTLAQSLMRPY